MLEIKNAGDQEWLNARGKKSLRSARWHLCSLSLASLLLDPTVACTLHFQCYILYNDLYRFQCYNLYITIFTIISASCTTIFTKRFRSTYIYIYLYTLAQIRPPMLQDYSPHAKALGNNNLTTLCSGCNNHTATYVCNTQ